MKNVAVIGAGPGGLVAARYLKSEGFNPVLYEQGARIGGQWSADPNHSGVWPAMRTNTSRIMTSFSDLPHYAGCPTYPTNEAMGEYLHHYADHFDLTPCIRLKSPVRELRRDAKSGWMVRTDAGEDHYEQVVIATGRYNRPSIPDVPGLKSFSGSGGVCHAFAFKHPEGYRDRRVLVAGCQISSLEIASDLAMLGAARVVVTHRKQRYVLPKLINGVPTDHVGFTRFSALAEECLPPEVLSAALKQFVLSVAGSPEQFGAPKPPDTFSPATFTQSHFFLPLVAEGRITVKPWIDSVKGEVVRFKDGSSETFDAILFGTGYHLNLPYLSEDIRRALDIDEHHLDLYKHTFHPDLSGLAFIGLFQLAGPYYPALELQARWIAYTFSGAQPTSSQDDMRDGIALYRAHRNGSQVITLAQAAILFARAAGVEPELEHWPHLARPLLFGPLTPMSFRLSGRDSLPDAPERFAAEAQLFGCMPSNEFAPAQILQLQALAAARNSPLFSRYIASVCSRNGALHADSTATSRTPITAAV
ncbi:MAG: flavin-containing monooxygenase [Acidobacteriaceae bacterium]